MKGIAPSWSVYDVLDLSDIEGLPRRINMGCGYDKRAGYLNIDVDPACQPDLLLEANAPMPLPDGMFEEILAWDVLEHIPHAFTMSALLDWAALLETGGLLRLETSYLFGVTEVMRRDENFATDFNWTRCLFGNQAHPGDYHFVAFTERTLAAHLQAAGFEHGPLKLRDGWLISAEAVKRRDWLRLTHLPVEEAVERAYRDFLERPLPEDKRAYYVESHQNGVSVREIVKQIAASPEHLYRIGGHAQFRPELRAA